LNSFELDLGKSKGKTYGPQLAGPNQNGLATQVGGPPAKEEQGKPQAAVALADSGHHRW
jgi:hypothetical protein